MVITRAAFLLFAYSSYFYINKSTSRFHLFLSVFPNVTMTMGIIADINDETIFADLELS